MDKMVNEQKELTNAEKVFKDFLGGMSKKDILNKHKLAYFSNLDSKINNCLFSLDDAEFLRAADLICLSYSMEGIKDLSVVEWTYRICKEKLTLQDFKKFYKKDNKDMLYNLCKRILKLSPNWNKLKETLEEVHMKEMTSHLGYHSGTKGRSRQW